MAPLYTTCIGRLSVDLLLQGQIYANLKKGEDECNEADCCCDDRYYHKHRLAIQHEPFHGVINENQGSKSNRIRGRDLVVKYICRIPEIYRVFIIRHQENSKRDSVRETK